MPSSKREGGGETKGPEKTERGVRERERETGGRETEIHKMMEREGGE